MEVHLPHRMQLPREVLVGEKILGQAGDICKKLGFKSSAIILTSTHGLDAAAREVSDSLEKNGFKISLEIVKESNIDNVKRAEKRIEETKSSVVLGIGGGKTIDVAKLAASRKRIPFISVPTALSHDGISSSRATIKGLTGPSSMNAEAPTAIIGDVHVISNSPYKLTASGCGDIVAKHIAVNDWKLAHKVNGEYYGEYAANLALMSARLTMKCASIIRNEKEDGLRVVLEALISCGVAMSIAGSSRPCSGSEHLFSHALDIVSSKPALHGEQCGVGSIMMAYLWGANWKGLKEKLEIIGAPTTAKELGVDSGNIVEALVLAQRIRPERYTILSVKKIDEKAAKKLAQATGVI